MKASEIVIVTGVQQALNVGQTLVDTFAVLTVDGTSQTVTVTINGANDAPVVTSSGSTTAWTESAAITGNRTTDPGGPHQRLNVSVKIAMSCGIENGTCKVAKLKTSL